MSERGFTMLETLLAAAVLGVVLLGVGTFYVSTVRVERENSNQIYLQRQVEVIFGEMTKQIGEATANTLVIPCTGVTTDSIQVTNSRGVYCFRRDDAGTGLLEIRPGGGQWNLLSGTLATLETTTGTCPDNGGFCPTLLTKGPPPPPPPVTVGAAIKLRLRVQFPESTGYQTMTFPVTIAARNTGP